MYNYDVRNQIKAENKSKLFGEACVMFLVIAVSACIMYTIQVENPFHISSPSTDKELSALYREGMVYIKIDHADLTYTGYYKEDRNEKALYNCYKMVLDKLDYFVFVPIERSGKDLDNPDMLLKNYSFQAKIKKDGDLFELVSEDYGLSVKEFLKQYNVSPIVMDESENNRSQIMVVWCLFFASVTGCILYIVRAFWKVGNVRNRKEVRELGDMEEIEGILDSINQDVEENKILDTNKVKITKHWLLAFYDGRILITQRSKIIEARGKEKVRKAYGIAKIGYHNFIELELENGDIYEIAIEELEDYEEILEILSGKKISTKEVSSK